MCDRPVGGHGLGGVHAGSMIGGVHAAPMIGGVHAGPMEGVGSCALQGRVLDEQGVDARVSFVRTPKHLAPSHAKALA